ncbi:molybdenum cofactor guanylyltransferase [Demequina silvatica]|uniref:molybdenum cofactor guanylyltransferase n=1 Tax=Demequina silvatica TaxID=1638988 RepID=UPI000784B36F|nr:NTP transferase domain-containing protein [Demequina silvatica]
MTDSAVSLPFDAMIIAGGRGTRLGGVSKPDLVVGGRPLLDLALEAVAGAACVAVVGGPRRDEARWTVEEPAGAGPAAALAAGLAELARDRDRGPSPVTVVLGVDTPLAGEAVPVLVAAASAAHGAWVVDGEGFPQFLLAAYPTASLASRCSADLAGASLRRLVGDLPMTAVPDVRGLSRDLDTPDDQRYWKERMG